MLIMLYVLYVCAFLFFIYKRARVLMHFFQQEEYDNIRLLKYIINNTNLIDKKFSLSLIVLLLFNLIDNNIILHLSFLISILILFGWLQHNPCKQSKKPLLITSRVKRLFIMNVLIATIISTLIICYAKYNSPLLYALSLLLVQTIPLLIMIANILLIPIEKIIQHKYLTEAKTKLAKYNPTIIAITGSYGKTSTKHILSNILSSVAPTLATPGSVNTVMGITRIIREQLKTEHKFFIVEMGAYGKGSITRLCKLTPPACGIITAIGNAHFERFKSIENVAQTKFELVQAIRENNQGFVVINANQVAQNFIAKYCVNTPITIASNIAATYNISQITQTITGVSFQIAFNHTSYHINSNLYGLQHVENMALSFALAHTIGISPETIAAALTATPQIRHRLEVIKEKAKPIIIDDAYNANPAGFAAALAVLQTFKTNGYRSIIVTPGIVELGALHDEKHFQLGEQTAEVVDYALIILPNRIQTFINGFYNKATNKQKLLTFNTFQEAKQWLTANTQNNDVILFANDLPDLYETKIKF